ncbi:MAG TPA: metallophosphoesterase [Kofleriaceae bacterium]|nr:metallophosphoesterase [Kofleriaceae bacterium]
MTTLLHISDLHFGDAYAERVGRAVIEVIARVQPDAVIASGDLVEWAEYPRSWRDLRGFLRRIESPMITIPGNHDIDRLNVASRLRHPFRAYQRAVHPDIDRVLAIPGAHIVGIGTPKRWTLDLGFVSEAQIEWTESAFAGAAPGALKVLTLHHGLRSLGPARFRRHVRGNQRVLACARKMGVDLVLTGHSHFPHAEVMAGGNGHSLVWSQAGTATCRRFRPPFRNAVSVVRAGPERIDIEVWGFRRKEARFLHDRNTSFSRRWEQRQSSGLYTAPSLILA